MELILKDENIKPLLKEVILEILKENKKEFKELFAEVLEEIAMKNAIDKGLKSPTISEDELMKVLNEDWN